MTDLNVMAKEVHKNAINHGWWDKPRSLEETLALIHSEWSEALEEYRAGRPMIWYECNEIDHVHPSPCNPKNEYDCLAFDRQETCASRGKKPEGIAVELIDGCIRILDLFGKMGLEFDSYTTPAELSAGIIGETEDNLSDLTLPELVCLLHRYTSDAITDGSIPAEKDKVYKTVSSLITAEAIVYWYLTKNGIDPDALMNEKHRYNISRPYRHGGKKA